MSGIGSSIILRRLLSPTPKRSMKRRRLGVLQEERHIGDAQTSILKQRPREVRAHIVQDGAERRALLAEATRQGSSAYRERFGD